jgi:hypothetical protein
MCGDVGMAHKLDKKAGVWGDCGGREIYMETWAPHGVSGSLLRNAFMGTKVKLGIALRWVLFQI